MNQVYPISSLNRKCTLFPTQSYTIYISATFAHWPPYVTGVSPRLEKRRIVYLSAVRTVPQRTRLAVPGLHVSDRASHADLLSALLQSQEEVVSRGRFVLSLYNI